MNNTLKRTNRSCPMCDHPGGIDHADSRDNGWHLKTCAQCDFVYLQDPPDYAAFVHDFAWENTFAVEAERRKSSEPVLNAWSRFTKFIRHRIFKRNKQIRLIRDFIGSGRVLDVGCGGGVQNAHWIDKQYEPWGVEISAGLAKVASEFFARHGGQCLQNDAVSAMSGMPDNFFDGILMMSYLEHELNPSGVCKSAFGCLKQGGHLIIKVPNHACWNRYVRGEKWCGYRFPDHVNYFTPASLSKLLKDTGFSIVKFGWNDRFPTSDNMWLIAQKPKAA